MGTLLNAVGDLAVPSAAELEEADKLAELITLTFGTTNDGKAYWVYAAIRPSRYQAFMADTNAKKRIDIEQYGWTITYGFGRTVPPEVKKQMQELYGFDENYPATLLKKAKEEQKGFVKKKEDDRLSGIVAMLKQQKPS